MTARGLQAQQLQKMQTPPGFIAALDQSGGSTPNALRDYGITAGAWSNEEEMFARVHQMRTRIMTSPSFTGEAKGIFGTKMRSVIKPANAAGIKDIVNQQFDVAGQIIATGLVPIIEPEVDIHCPDKAEAEEVLKVALLAALNARLDTYMQSIFEASNT